MTIPQIRSAIHALPGGQGIDGGLPPVPAAAREVSGAAGPLKRRLAELRAAVLEQRALEHATHEAADAARADADRAQQDADFAPLPPLLAGGADAAGPGAADERPVAAVSPAQRDLTAAQQRSFERRESEIAAAELLAGEDGDSLRKPCEIPLSDGIPFAARPAACTAYMHCLKDMQWAAALAKVDPVAGAQREAGAWVVFLRLFPAAVLRDVGGGGETGGRRVLSLLNKWGTGKYLETYYAPVRPRNLQNTERDIALNYLNVLELYFQYIYTANICRCE